MEDKEVFSIEPEELKMLVQESKGFRQALGGISYGATQQELASLGFRRSLYVTKDMKVGERITSKNMRAIRPGYGLAARYFQIVLGKRVKVNVKVGTPIGWDFF